MFDIFIPRYYLRGTRYHMILLLQQYTVYSPERFFFFFKESIVFGLRCMIRVYTSIM